jgi:hypothetical protein
MGSGSGQALTTGTSNLLLGNSAGGAISSGQYNTVVGNTSGGGSAAVTYGVYVGFSVAASSGTPTNEIVVANNRTGNGSNTVTLGNNSSTTIYIPPSITANTGTLLLNGNPETTTQATSDNSTRIATTAYVKSNLTNYVLATTLTLLYAPLASPALTGTPTAPTASSGTNTTQIATTAFVQSGLGSYLPLTGGTITGGLLINSGGRRYAQFPATGVLYNQIFGNTYFLSPDDGTTTSYGTLSFTGVQFGLALGSSFDLGIRTAVGGIPTLFQITAVSTNVNNILQIQTGSSLQWGTGWGIKDTNAVTYGNVTTAGAGKNSWQGYDVNGRWTWMGNPSSGEAGFHDSSYSWIYRAYLGTFEVRRPMQCLSDVRMDANLTFGTTSAGLRSNAASYYGSFEALTAKNGYTGMAVSSNRHYCMSNGTDWGLYDQSYGWLILGQNNLCTFQLPCVFNSTLNGVSVLYDSSKLSMSLGVSVNTGTAGSNTNIIVGVECGRSLTSAAQCVIMGYVAGDRITTGNQNTCIGYQAGRCITTGALNTCIGQQAMGGTSAGTGSYNCGMGHYTFVNITSGSFNSALGVGAGTGLTTGNYNCYIGTNAQPSAASVSKEVVICNSGSAVGLGTNTCYIQALYCLNGLNVTVWTTTSDRNIKKNIVPLTNELHKILALRPVHFNYKEDDREGCSFIAQEFKEIFPELHTTHAPNQYQREVLGLTEVEAIRVDIMPHVIRAIQEQQEMIVAQQTQIDALIQHIATLTNAVNNLLPK